MANAMLLMGKPALHHFIMTTNNWSVVVCVVEISFAFNHILFRFDVMDSRRMYHKYNQNKSGFGVSSEQ